MIRVAHETGDRKANFAASVRVNMPSSGSPAVDEVAIDRLAPICGRVSVRQRVDGSLKKSRCCGKCPFSLRGWLNLGLFSFTRIENSYRDFLCFMDEAIDNPGLPAKPFPERSWRWTSDHNVSNPIFFSELQ